MSSKNRILNKISSLYNSLTKTEKRIADTILANPYLLNQASLAETAHALNVGDATFIRFCRTLGFKGFSDFKLDLAIELATHEQNDSELLDTVITAEDDAHHIALKLHSSINNVIEETISLLDFDVLQQVATHCRHAKRIFLFGVGSSGQTAEEAKNKFMRIGLQVDASSNNHFMYMQAALMQPGDVVIGISHSGASEETAYALHVSRQAGAVTVALTHNLRSPLTKEADFVLNNGHRQGKMQGDSIGTKVAQLFVLDLIYALLVQGEQESAVKNKQKTLEVISAKQIK